MTKKLLVSIASVVIVGIGFVAFSKKQTQTKIEPVVQQNPAVVVAPTQAEKVVEPVVKQEVPPVKTPEAKETPTSLIDAVDHEVPFMAQAPTANWDAFHEDACEEASAAMVWHYFNKTKIASTDQFEQELSDAAVWERANVGTDTSISANDAVRMLKEHFTLDAELVTNVSAEQMKTELSQNHLIILPAGGRDLHNPNFKSPGPLYHMLVVRGYDGSGRFITNDPGTRKGEKYTYDPKVLLAAIHDWNGGDVESGAKIAIVIRGVLQ